MRRAGRGLGLVALAVCLAGCASTVSPSPAAPSTPAATPGRFAGAPAAVRERIPVPPCGEETTTYTAGFNVDGRRCFWAAYLGRSPAEFITTQPTDEGDPITTIYRVLPDGRLEIFVDSTKDRFSSMTWSRLDCLTLSLIAGAPGQPAFGLGTGCRESALP